HHIHGVGSIWADLDAGFQPRRLQLQIGKEFFCCFRLVRSLSPTARTMSRSIPPLEPSRTPGGQRLRPRQPLFCLARPTPFLARSSTASRKEPRTGMTRNPRLTIPWYISPTVGADTFNMLGHTTTVP